MAVVKASEAAVRASEGARLIGRLGTEMELGGLREIVGRATEAAGRPPEAAGRVSEAARRTHWYRAVTLRGTFIVLGYIICPQRSHWIS